VALRLVIVHDHAMNALALVDNYMAFRLVIIDNRAMSALALENDILAILAAAGTHPDVSLRTPADRGLAVP
jgi:hypothetical protein